MNRPPVQESTTPAAAALTREVQPPLIWTFDGPFVTCLFDVEDTLRRAIVQIGDVSRVVLRVELSLAALRERVESGEAVQPAWGHFLEALTRRYGLPVAPSVRYLKTMGPLVTLVIIYRS
jgi:hypothetical protein